MHNPDKSGDWMWNWWKEQEAYKATLTSYAPQKPRSEDAIDLTNCHTPYEGTPITND